MAPFWRRTRTPAAATHAVITHLPLPEEVARTGSLDTIFALEDRFETALAAIGAEHDGNEVGADEVVFYAYGPDADAMLQAVRQCLSGFEVRAGAYAVQRFGEVDDPDAREERVEL